MRREQEQVEKEQPRKLRLQMQLLSPSQSFEQLQLRPPLLLQLQLHPGQQLWQPELPLAWPHILLQRPRRLLRQVLRVEVVRPLRLGRRWSLSLLLLLLLLLPAGVHPRLLRALRHASQWPQPRRQRAAFRPELPRARQRPPPKHRSTSWGRGGSCCQQRQWGLQRQMRRR